MKKQKGFTLIELLVVIAIIAILSTVVMAGLNSARMKGRDAKRLSDIKQLQAALELCFDDSATGYPGTSGTAYTCTAGATCAAISPLACGTTNTMATYMNPMPTPPTPGANYVYTPAGTTYAITFTLEGPSGSLPLGLRTATPSGIR